MNRQSFLYQVPPRLTVILVFLGYMAFFVMFHDWAMLGIASLAIIPVMSASWYLGTAGGVVTAIITILANTAVLVIDGHHSYLYGRPDSLIGALSLIMVAIITGRFTTIIHERRDALQKLKQYERDRASHTKFLEQLNSITARALEADSFQSNLEILTKEIAHLFNADDAFFSLWDAIRDTPIPTIAFGSMKDIYPFVQFEPHEITLTTSLMKMERPIAVADIEDSQYISPRVAAIFPSRSMLGIPLITQQRKLGAILLGYDKKRIFDDEVLLHARVTAEQVALVLSKSQLLEDERKQVRQLTALHDVALIAIDADDEDQLIEKVVNIIGQNLFTDNFGVLLLDENKEILHAHPSYRFYSSERLVMKDIAITEGITGEVARTGLPQRIGNVRRVQQYVDVDDRTISELCVPIKFKERILGVINAESTKRDAFTMDDERLLVTLAGQLATALEQLRRTQSEHKWLEQLAHSRDLAYSIARISTQIESSMSADEIIESLGGELHKIGFTCIMAKYDKDQKSFVINYTSLPPDLLEFVDRSLGYPLIKFSFPFNKLGSLIKPDDINRAMVLHDPASEIEALFTNIKQEGIGRILKKIGVTASTEPIRLPIMFEKNLIGLLWVWGKDIVNSDLPILSILAKQIGISLERARLFQEVQNLALTDPLTGLQNRRSVFEVGKIEFSRAQRFNRPFCCMMLDLDHFKKINDNHGHQTGDQVLIEFARRCKSSIREMDIIGRYGGEELIVLLPETDRDTAVQVAERLRKTTSGKPIPIEGGEITLTVSIGVAAMDENTPHMDALVARADQALYIAKHKGRDRVAISV